MKTISKTIIILLNIIVFASLYIPVALSCCFPYSEEVIFKTAGRKIITYAENLLTNPGFEIMDGWSTYGDGYTVTTQEAHTGRHSIRISAEDPNKRYGVFQVVSLEFEEGSEQKIVIGGWSKKEKGATGKLYADVYTKDGSETQYGLIVDFSSPLKNQWYYHENIFTIKKPSDIVLYVMVSDQLGSTIYFDDIFLAKTNEIIDKGFFVFDDTIVSSPDAKENIPNNSKHTVASQEGLSLALTSNGKVTSLDIDGKSYLYDDSVSLSGFFVRDIAHNSDFNAIRGPIVRIENTLQQKSILKNLELEFNNTYSATKDYIQIAGEVKNLSTNDRAITVYFALPINASGWFWRNDIRSSLTIKNEMVDYMTTDGIGTAGKSSIYPISVITKDVNLSYGVRLDEPRVVRMAYNLRNKLYYIAFDLGLSSVTQKFPSRANFSFIIYKSNPEWGFRSAIRRYYDFYPEFFVKRVKREGIWLPGTHILKKIQNPEDYGFMFHHGLYDVDIGDLLEIYSCEYVAMQIKVHCLYDAQLMPSINEIMDSLKIKNEISDTKSTFNSLIYDANGQLKYSISKVGWFVDQIKGKADERGWSWCGILSLNPDPEIPGGVGQQTYKAIFNNATAYEKNGMIVDGVSFDGISTEYLNFRQEHFKYVDFPLSFDYATKKPAIVDAFSNYEFVKYVADKEHFLGKILMANGFPAHYMFVSHLIDSANIEVGRPISDSKANLARSLLYQKPYSYMLKGDFSQSSVHSQIEIYMRKSLFYGAFLTVFNTFGGGEDSNYFEHPEWYEKDRPLFKKYVPLMKAVSQAGWEPVTYAICSDADVYIERYGDARKDSLYFTLWNNSKTSKSITLYLQTTKLDIGNGKIIAEEILNGNMLSSDYDNKRGLLAVNVSIAGDDVILLRIK